MTDHARVILCLALSCWGGSACEPHAGPASVLEASKRPSLQAIEVLKRSAETSSVERVVVTDVAYRGGRWGEGRVLIIDPVSRTLLGAHYPLQANPVDITQVEGGFVTLQAGTLTLGERPVSAHASVSWHPMSAPLEGAGELSWLSDPLSLGYPVSALEDPRQPTDQPELSPPLLMSSGVSGAVWSVAGGWATLNSSEPLSPLPAQSSLYAPSDQLSLGALVSWRGRPLVIDFNADLLSLLQEDGSYAPCQAALGRFSEVMEGAQTPRVFGDQLVMSFGLSGELVELDLRDIDWSDEGCVVTRSSYSPPLGAVPNDLVVSEDWVYVLHSGDQDVWVYDRATLKRSARWQLPDQSHPWGMTNATLPEGERLLITSWLSGDLLSLNPENGAVERLLSGDELSAPPPRVCSRAREVEGQGPLRLGEAWTELSFAQQPEVVDTALSSAHIHGAPQLALSFQGGDATLELEVQRQDARGWEPLGELMVIPRERLEQAAHQAVMREASRVSLTGLETGAEPPEDPCERFLPTPAVIRLRLSALSSPAQGRALLHRLRIRVKEGDEPALMTDAVFRLW